MNPKDPDKAQQREMADAVLSRVSLTDIRLSKLDLELYNVAPLHPVRAANKLENTEFASAGRLVVYYLPYRFSTTDKDDKSVWDVSFTLNVSFNTSSDAELSEAQIKAFGKLEVVNIAHPYARELIHNLTVRMNMPALVLEVLQTPFESDQPSKRGRQ